MNLLLIARGSLLLIEAGCWLGSLYYQRNHKLATHLRLAALTCMVVLVFGPHAG